VVRYVRSQPSLTRQRNIGIDDVSGDVVVFLDDDVSIQPDLFALLEQAYEDETIVGVTGRIVEPESKRRLGPASALRRLLPGGGREGTFTRYGYPRYLRDLNTPRDVEFMQGCFMSARREAAASVRFDEHLGGYALAEDEDFSYRLSRLGRIRYLPQLIVRHRKLGFGSADERRFGCLVVVNRAYLFRKNFRRTPLARAQFAMLVAMLVGHRVVNREWRGAQGLLEGAYQVLRGRS
jgi:GT2 family glycosyltransferase